ncbi:MAG TPA: hypothetical protein VFT82_01445 [Candidatus Paceibacterota bacterium]|nr:hypothetical protein [Candidatus Paceibacterota bacterium]
MNKKPFYNAILASGYIALLIDFMNWTSKFQAGESNLLIPILMLSLLVLSVAIMGYLFFYEPVTLLIDGKRTEAVSSFLKTTVTFAAITAIFGALAAAYM